MKKAKLALIVRRDLGMGTGKIAAQTGHAVTEAVIAGMKANNADFLEWYATGMKKVCLGVTDEDHLDEILLKASLHKVPCYVITDAGLTQNPAGTRTCAAIGPATEQKMKRITGSLKLYD